MSSASQPSYSLHIPPNNHSTTGMDINIDINKSDTAESTSRAERACILSLHWRYMIHFLGGIFVKSNILTKQPSMCHCVDCTRKTHHVGCDGRGSPALPVSLQKPADFIWIQQPDVLTLEKINPSIQFKEREQKTYTSHTYWSQKSKVDWFLNLDLLLSLLILISSPLVHLYIEYISQHNFWTQAYCIAISGCCTQRLHLSLGRWSIQ